MPVKGIAQPEYLPIDDTLRLRRFDGKYGFALAWYQDAETARLVDGKAEPYDMDKLGRMYRYLDARGELYFIEVFRGGAFSPVGDVTFWQEDCPIVIGDPDLRGHGVGRRVIAALIGRGKELGYGDLRVNEIYDFNTASQRLFTGLGFEKYEKTEKGWRYRLPLKP